MLREAAEQQLEAYLNRQRKNRPQVILKLAVSADGMIGRKGEGQVAITGPHARAQSHVLRSESDAILVGIGTVLADDPELTCRLPGLEDRSPLRVVLDRRLDMPLASKLVRTARKGRPLLIVAAPGADRQRKSALEAAVAEVLDSTDIASLLAELAQRGISALIVEGGAGVARSFLAQKAVDRIVLFSSPVVVGEGGVASPVTEHTVPGGFRLRSEERLGDDRMGDYILEDSKIEH